MPNRTTEEILKSAERVAKLHETPPQKGTKIYYVELIAELTAKLREREEALESLQGEAFQAKYCAAFLLEIFKHDRNDLEDLQKGIYAGLATSFNLIIEALQTTPPKKESNDEDN